MQQYKELEEVARIGVSDEYNDHIMYLTLSEKIKGNKNLSSVLKQLAEKEYKHYMFWRKYTKDTEPKVKKLRLNIVMLLRLLFGLTFAVRYLERHEGQVIKKYRSVEHLIPENDRAEYQEMLADEEQHEKEFSTRIESSTVRYISFIVLGLADALVEISGIHAGSLGIYESTEIAGLAGIIAGAAASLAMASAAFAQAKQGFQGSAKLSALYTGVSYFVAAVVLAAPYFMTKSMVVAISISLFFAVLILVATTYYGAVITAKPFTRDFAEITLIMFGATAVLYVFGYFIRLTTGITI
jgi:VIT1/CCC1 family predicted Fe2+/Mn2+ transporter